MENCRKSRFCSALKKGCNRYIRGASVMFVRRMCISTLWSFQNQCRVNTHFCRIRDGGGAGALRGSSVFTKSDSESIFQQQFGENHGDGGCYSIYFDCDTIFWLSRLL